MSADNVITFPGRGFGRRLIEAKTPDLLEALWMAAFLLREWEGQVFEISAGTVVLVDEDGRPAADRYGSEPTVELAGTRRTVTEIVTMAPALDLWARLPAHMLIFFAIWNSEDPDNPVLTYGDAVELMDGALDGIQWEKEHGRAGGTS